MGKKKICLLFQNHKNNKSKDQPYSQEARVMAVLMVAQKHSKQTSEPKCEQCQHSMHVYHGPRGALQDHSNN